jgi:hypothetical protein
VITPWPTRGGYWSPRRARPRTTVYGCPIGALVASHGFSFLWNYLYRGEYRSAQLARLMTKPYGRVVAMHVAIILGGIGVAALGSPVWALLILLGVKVGIDLKAHVKEHSGQRG